MAGGKLLSFFTWPYERGQARAGKGAYASPFTSLPSNKDSVR
jgi:hypothetical protein